MAYLVIPRTIPIGKEMPQTNVCNAICLASAPQTRGTNRDNCYSRVRRLQRLWALSSRSPRGRGAHEPLLLKEYQRLVQQHDLKSRQEGHIRATYANAAANHSE